MSKEKKQRIMQAAEQLFRTRRVHEVTLDEIARQADVGKGTIYLYFSDKEDVVFQAAVAGFDDMCRLLRENATHGDTFRERLLNTCAYIVAFFQARRPLFRIILSEGERDMEGSGPGLRQRWKERRRIMTEAVAAIIAQGVAAGEIRTDIPSEMLSEYLLGMLRTRSWELEGWPEEQRSPVAVVDLFLNGAGVPSRTPVSTSS
ncbi:MAG TPA: TetR/AcrR family transcriptional regulator [Opitutaceae bacterium]|nr:TetR/AcrR family transcriptional regulator [Opitutaceae bacterium]